MTSRLHERCFRVIHNGCHSSNEKLLNRTKSVPIDHLNLHIFVTEIFTVYTGIDSKILLFLVCFKLLSNCNLHNQPELTTRPFKFFKLFETKKWGLVSSHFKNVIYKYCRPDSFALYTIHSSDKCRITGRITISGLFGWYTFIADIS